jgi:hypothetical protein
MTSTFATSSASSISLHDEADEPWRGLRGSLSAPWPHASVPQRAHGRSENLRTDDWCARAKKRRARLLAVLAKLIPSPANAARALEVLVTLCVDNQQIAAADTIPDTSVGAALQAVGVEFELSPRTSLPPSRRPSRQERSPRAPRREHRSNQSCRAGGANSNSSSSAHARNASAAFCRSASV